MVTITKTETHAFNLGRLIAAIDYDANTYDCLNAAKREFPTDHYLRRFFVDGYQSYWLFKS